MKINPFEPYGPVNPGSFVGRLDELRRLKSALLQTSAGKPVNFMITGERGIGKTSLLNYLKYAAEGLIQVEHSKLSFVVVDTDVDPNTTQLGLIAKIELGLEKFLGRQEAGEGKRGQATFSPGNRESNSKGAFYHFIVRGNQRQIFRDDGDRLYYLERVEHYRQW
jgi:AAA ATPase domain